jgi:hypothetical protein
MCYLCCLIYGAKRNEYKVLVGKLEGRKPLGTLVVDGRIILK